MQEVLPVSTSVHAQMIDVESLLPSWSRKQKENQRTYVTSLMETKAERSHKVKQRYEKTYPDSKQLTLVEYGWRKYYL